MEIGGNGGYRYGAIRGPAVEEEDPHHANTSRPKSHLVLVGMVLLVVTFVLVIQARKTPPGTTTTITPTREGDSPRDEKYNAKLARFEVKS